MPHRFGVFTSSYVLDLCFALLQEYYGDLHRKRVVISANDLDRRGQTPWDVAPGYGLYTTCKKDDHASLVFVNADTRQINHWDGLGMHSQQDVEAKIRDRYLLRPGANTELWLGSDRPGEAVHGFEYCHRYVSPQIAKHKCFPFAAVVLDRLVAFDNDFERLAAEQLPAEPHVLVAGRLLRACGYQAEQETRCVCKPYKISDMDHDVDGDESECAVLNILVQRRP